MIARPPVRSDNAIRCPSPSKRSSTPSWTSAFGVHARAEPDLIHQVHRRLLEHAGADALLDVLAVAPLDHHRLDAPQLQQPGEHQPGGSASDDRHLGTHTSGAYLIPFAFRTTVLMRTQAEITSLADAVRDLVNDGDTVALEGFTHLIPVAAGQEIIRQRKRDLTLVRMTPDIVYDQLIGAGCARKLIFSWGGNPGVGSLHRFREAVQTHELEIEEHSHAGMANRYVAAASNLPFAVMRGYNGTSLPEHTDTIKPITCPFTGEQLTAVPALDLDVGIIHAQQADKQGNVQLWGQVGVQKETVLGAKRSLVTVEEIVDELEPKPERRRPARAGS